jgi:penicillin amidase
MRMLVDLGNLGNSLLIHTTGQSGHAYHPHYADMTDLWRNIQYHPMLWGREQVEAGAEGHLRLTP